MPIARQARRTPISPASEKRRRRKPKRTSSCDTGLTSLGFGDLEMRLSARPDATLNEGVASGLKGLRSPPRRRENSESVQASRALEQERGVARTCERKRKQTAEPSGEALFGEMHRVVRRRTSRLERARCRFCVRALSALKHRLSDGGSLYFQLLTPLAPSSTLEATEKRGGAMRLPSRSPAAGLRGSSFCPIFRHRACSPSSSESINDR
jgi:hypothetical protein